MTNNEKFYETFGVHMELGASLCDISKCGKGSCKDCFIFRHCDDSHQYIDPKNFEIASPSKSFGKNDPDFEKVTKEQLLDELSKESLLLVATAYSYAKNLTLYGVDVTKVWNTIIENSYNMDQVYRKGYVDGRHDHNEDVIERIRRYSEILKKNEESEE